MKRIGYIYKTTNLINGKIYVGQHQRDEFDNKYYGSGIKLQRALKKYGKTNFKVEIIEWLETLVKLNRAEKQFIKAYDSTNPKIGYNISYGGDSCMKGLHHTEEAKRKIGEAAKGHKYGLGRKHTKEEKDKISEAQKGKKHSKEWSENIGNSLRGKKRKDIVTKETREKRSRSLMGHLVSEETRLKISLGHKGKMQSPEHVRKNSESHKGQIPWNKGLKLHSHSEETKAKMRLAQARRNELRLLNKESA